MMDISAEPERPTPTMRPANMPDPAPPNGGVLFERNTHAAQTHADMMPPEGSATWERFGAPSAPTGTAWEAPAGSTPQEKFNA